MRFDRFASALGLAIDRRESSHRGSIRDQREYRLSQGDLRKADGCVRVSLARADSLRDSALRATFLQSSKPVRDLFSDSLSSIL
jgi:hypothetical protein